jgi:hypothetical protein
MKYILTCGRSHPLVAFVFADLSPHSPPEQSHCHRPLLQNISTVVDKFEGRTRDRVRLWVSTGNGKMKLRSRRATNNTHAVKDKILNVIHFQMCIMKSKIIHPLKIIYIL